MRPSRLVVDRIACDGSGICHELFPERITLDDWGYPMVDDGLITGADARHARRAVAACPRLALKLVPAPADGATAVTPSPRDGDV
jgi:ferredoxin